MCEDISKSPGVREIGGRDGLLKKEQKKQKKRARERNNKQRRKNTRRERQHTFNTISTTDTKKNVYEENSGGIARRNTSAVSALCF